MSNKIKMLVEPGTFKRIDDPYVQKSKKYIFYVKIDNVSKEIPMATNPRNQKLTSNVAKAIEESLESNDEKFHLKNRGIVLSAGKVLFDNKNNEVTVCFDDDFTHGNIDGGHTYKLVVEQIGKRLNQFVQFEIMTGVEDIITELAESRNTSVQVDAKSLAELSNKFEPIKEGIEGLSFFKRIAFKQNQLEMETGYADGKSKKLKMIDAREIVAIISMFDIERYTKDKHPLQAYSSKAVMLKKYLENPEKYRKFVNIMPDIFDLYDDIESEFAKAYNKTGGRYGRKSYSGKKGIEDDNKIIGLSKFRQDELKYKVPDGFVYPILSGFRALVELDDESDKYRFKKDPKEVWEITKQDIAKKVMSQASTIGDNPNAVGKDPNTWDFIYMTVLLEIL